MADILKDKLEEEVKIFMSHSVAADKSPDVTNIIWLAVFVRVINENIIETEEILNIKPIKSTTSKNCGEESLEMLNGDWLRNIKE